MQGTEAACPQIVAESSVMRQVLALADTVAQGDCPVLIEGDSGTGKDLIAQRIHAMSPRAKEPFIPVNCAGISAGVFESQLFGHARGAFTGAEQSTLGLVRCADKGTLFLDEIGEMSLDLQPKLLRVIQEREVMPVGLSKAVYVDVRFVVATNRNLQDEARQGRFRHDLYYRLNVVHIYIPPLSARREDILALIDHFLQLFAKRYRKSPVRFTRQVRDRLVAYPWPGNARELATWVERLYATGLPPEVLATALELEALEHDEPTSMRTPPPPENAVMNLKENERELILRALEAAGDNRTRAAELLRIHRGTLIRKMQQYNITRTG